MPTRCPCLPTSSASNCSPEGADTVGEGCSVPYQLARRVYFLVHGSSPSFPWRAINLNDVWKQRTDTHGPGYGDRYARSQRSAEPLSCDVRKARIHGGVLCWRILKDFPPRKSRMYAQHSSPSLWPVRGDVQRRGDRLVTAHNDPQSIAPLMGVLGYVRLGSSYSY